MNTPASFRIEMTVPVLPIGGMESVIVRLTRRLLARGHQVGITCTESIGGFGEQLRAEGLRVQVVPTLGRRTLMYPRALARWLRETRPDIVHTHSGSWPKSALAARLAGAPCVIHTEHGLDPFEPWHGSPVKRWAAVFTDVVVAVSAPLADDLHRLARIPRKRLRVIANGIDTGEFRPGPYTQVVRGRFGLDASRFVIGHVARFSPEKNQRLLLDAFARLHGRFSHAFLALIGEGRLRPELEQQARQLGIGDHVGFFGYGHDLPPIYRDFDLLVLPSLAEGTSMTLLEAMAAGVPVIATAVGGNPDVLAGGAAGRLVPSGDAVALVAAMTELIQDGGVRRSLAEAGRQRAIEAYDEELVVDRYEELYRTCCVPRVSTLVPSVANG